MNMSTSAHPHGSETIFQVPSLKDHPMWQLSLVNPLIPSHFFYFSWVDDLFFHKEKKHG